MDTTAEKCFIAVLNTDISCCRTLFCDRNSKWECRKQKAKLLQAVYNYC